MTYKEQIKHPEWQRKRSHIMTRDDFRCRCCGNSDSQLHIHHLYYLPDTLIWDYDNEGLVSLCDDCHKKITKDLGKLSGIIAFKILCGNLDVLKKELLKLSL